MDFIGAPIDILFHWKGAEYKIKAWGINNDLPYAEVDPKNIELEAELKTRIKRDNGLKVYFGPGYICFIEDYTQE